MNWETITQLGVGGTFCITILILVFNFLNKKKTVDNCNNNFNHDSCVTRRECEQVQKTIQTRFDGLIDLTNAKFRSVEDSLEDVKKLIKNGHNN